MKKLLLLMALMGQAVVFGQALEKQSGNDSISKPIIPTEKQNLLKNVDVIFNMRFGLDNQFLDGNHTESKFNNNQGRLEIKGKIHEKVFFRFRDRYTKTKEPGSRDNFARSTDIAFIGVDVTPNTQVTLGKMSADWGGYEFDLNPIDIVEYNDILEYADNFLTGVGITHKVNPNHTFGVQVLNARNSDFEDIYKGTVPVGVETSKTAMAYITNWRGSFFDGKFETIYSYSYFQEAKKKGMNYYSLGHKYQDNKLTLMYDFKYSNEGLDRKGLVTGMLNSQGDNQATAQDVSYMENWLKMEYLATPKLNLSLTLMTSDAYGKNVTPEQSGTNHLRTSYGFIPELQYIPFKDINIRFFVSYVGRYYKHSGFAKDQLGLENYNTGRLSIGFVAPLLIL
ncbi:MULTISPECIES: porin [Myroides]|uniref:Phosphate-selective porin O and P n=1 Tax=Myroides albus TaxID=2562892 RepID=A0A6I3LQ06_9FLAO|nr:MULTISPECIES: porin [Myroides]MTG98731.1 hypothetical protein [Myroides albus]MVX34659.1 hypothetical protein [Myroides sp. LoEW2-1]UVD79070.1 OprO/OprP family phosphate-selective porin [Myroides albus]